VIPLFYKSHYEVLAELIHQEYVKGNAETQAAVGTLAIKLCALFQQDNAKFNRETFLKACGIYEDVRANQL